MTLGKNKKKIFRNLVYFKGKPIVGIDNKFVAICDNAFYGLT